MLGGVGGKVLDGILGQSKSCCGLIDGLTGKHFVGKLENKLKRG